MSRLHVVPAKLADEKLGKCELKARSMIVMFGKIRHVNFVSYAFYLSPFLKYNAHQELIIILKRIF